MARLNEKRTFITLNTSDKKNGHTIKTFEESWQQRQKFVSTFFCLVLHQRFIILLILEEKIIMFETFICHLFQKIPIE